MANHGPSYGLDAELEAKRNANYDSNLENDVRAWIERLTGDSIGPDFHAGLKSGVILCKYVLNLSSWGSKKYFICELFVSYLCIQYWSVMLTFFNSLANKLKPGSVPKIQKSAMPFVQMVKQLLFYLLSFLFFFFFFFYCFPISYNFFFVLTWLM